MDKIALSIQEASWKIKWTLDRIDLALERMNETKYTVQLDDKSVLQVNELHRGLISDQKLALEEYKLEQKETFAQYKRELKEIVHGHGVWLSSRAVIIAIATIEAIILLLGILAYYYAKGKFS